MKWQIACVSPEVRMSVSYRLLGSVIPVWSSIYSPLARLLSGLDQQMANVYLSCDTQIGQDPGKWHDANHLPYDRSSDPTLATLFFWQACWISRDSDERRI